MEGRGGSLEEVCSLATHSLLDIKAPSRRREAFPRLIDIVNMNGDVAQAVIMITMMRKISDRLSQLGG